MTYASRRSGGSLWHWAVFAVVAFLVTTPVISLVFGSFSSARLPNDFDIHKLTLNNYATVWLDPRTYKVFLNTFTYVAGATTIGIVVATAFAWLCERTNISGKIWIYAGVPLTLAMPGMLQAMAYVLLLSPRIGFLNKGIQWLGFPPINIYSLGGMVFIEGIRLVPTAFLMLVPLFKAMDPVLEEAAAMSGARPHATLRKVSLRLMLPGLLAVVIYQAMTALEVFEIPGILGLPGQIYVFSTKIYSILHGTEVIPPYGQANALAMIYLLIAGAATWFYMRVIGRSERYTIVTGKAYRPRMIDLGGWRWMAWILVSVFMLFSVILPFLVLLFVSFLPYLQPPSAAAFHSMSLVNYRNIFAEPLFSGVILNTLFLVFITSTMTVGASFLISLVVVRSTFWGRRLLDQLAFMPHAIPGIVMGLAFLWLFLQGMKIGIDVHGGIFAMSLAFTVSFIAYGTRAMNAAILQIHKDLEEAAYVSGAPRWRTVLRIFGPLMLPTFAGVWIWSTLHAVRQAGMPLMLYQGEENKVLSIMIWNLWSDGKIQQVGAIGALLIVLLLLLTVIVRLIGFGRRSNA